MFMLERVAIQPIAERCHASNNVLFALAVNQELRNKIGVRRLVGLGSIISSCASAHEYYCKISSLEFCAYRENNVY